MGNGIIYIPESWLGGREMEKWGVQNKIMQGDWGEGQDFLQILWNGVFAVQETSEVYSLPQTMFWSRKKWPKHLNSFSK